MKYLLYLLLFFSFCSVSQAMSPDEDESYTAKVRAPNGADLFFNLVKITSKNKNFWRSYYHNVKALVREKQRGSLNKGLLTSVYDLPNPQQPLTPQEYTREATRLASFIDLSPLEFKNLMGKIRTFNTNVQTRYAANAERMKENLAATRFSGLEVGIAGAGWANFMFENDKYRENIYGWTAFVSTIPLSKIDQSKALPWIPNVTRPHEFREFRTLYAPIVMSVDVIHNSTAPTSTHFGIFRNPLDIHRSFLSGNNVHGNIAPLLHGFAAAVEARFFGKTYMNTYPSKLMVDIMERAVGAQNIERLNVLESHPGCSREKWWNFAQWTVGGKPVVIKLRHLIPLFNARKTSDIFYVISKTKPKSPLLALADTTLRKKSNAVLLAVSKPKPSARSLFTISKQKSAVRSLTAIQLQGPAKKTIVAVGLKKPYSVPLIVSQPKLSARSVFTVSKQKSAAGRITAIQPKGFAKKPAVVVRLKKPTGTPLVVGQPKSAVRKSVFTIPNQRPAVGRITAIKPKGSAKKSAVVVQLKKPHSTPLVVSQPKSAVRKSVFTISKQRPAMRRITAIQHPLRKIGIRL